jgi:hypothetical protein
MLKFIIRWQNNTKYCPPTEEEREKYELPSLEETYAGIQAGLTKDRGRYLDRSGGYSICEAPSEADVFAALQKWRPNIDFDVRQVVPIEEALELAKQAVEKRKAGVTSK